MGHPPAGRCRCASAGRRAAVRAVRPTLDPHLTAPHDIALALAGGAQAAAVLAAERRRVAGLVAGGQRALAEIDDLLAYHDQRPAHDIELVSLVPGQVAAAPFLAAHTDVAATVLRAIAGLRSALRRTGHDRTGPWGATFPLEITEQVSGFVFARTSQPAGRPAPGTAWLPATAARAARTVHHGGPGTLAAAYDAALDMIDHQGWTAAGPVIEEYLALDTAPAAPPSIRLTVPIA